MSLHLKKALIAFAIFVVSLASYSYPIVKKGYAPDLDFPTLLAARNYAKTGSYAIEGDAGVFLSTSHIKRQGVQTGIANPLSAILYGHIFRAFGFQRDIPLYLSIALFSLFNVLVFFIGIRLSTLPIASIMGFMGAFIPVMATGALMGGFYEFGLFFFGLAFLCFIGPVKPVSRSSLLRMIVSGILFALAANARNAFAVSFVAIFLSDAFIHRSWRRSLALIAPFAIVFGLTLTPYSYLGAPNGYTTKDHIPFGQLGHLFDDPYQFYYNRDAFLKQLAPTAGLDRVGVIYAKRLGVDVSWKKDLAGYWSSIRFYPQQAIDLIVFGGPVVVALMFVGLRTLWRRQRDIAVLFVGWILLWYLALVYSQLANWDHFIEIIIPVIMLTALGLWTLIEIAQRAASGEHRWIRLGLPVAVILTLFVHLIYATKWKLHDVYRSSPLAAVRQIESDPRLATVAAEKRIAVGIHLVAAYAVVYDIDHDVIAFNQNTIEELIQSRMLKEVLESYNVGMLVGYDTAVAQLIRTQTLLPVVALEP